MALFLNDASEIKFPFWLAVVLYVYISPSRTDAPLKHQFYCWMGRVQMTILYTSVYHFFLYSFFRHIVLPLSLIPTYIFMKSNSCPNFFSFMQANIDLIFATLEYNDYLPVYIVLPMSVILKFHFFVHSEIKHLFFLFFMLLLRRRGH